MIIFILPLLMLLITHESYIHHPLRLVSRHPQWKQVLLLEPCPGCTSLLTSSPASVCPLDCPRLPPVQWSLWNSRVREHLRPVPLNTFFGSGGVYAAHLQDAMMETHSPCLRAGEQREGGFAHRPRARAALGGVQALGCHFS